MARIVLTLDGKVLRDLTLSKERITIGRGPQNDLMIDSPAVSAEHAAISTARGEVVLEDLNSTNGVYVNEQGRGTLEDNDISKPLSRQIVRCVRRRHAVMAGQSQRMVARTRIPVDPVF